jgi:hypothetical protein
MELIHQAHQAHFFTNNADLSATPSVMSTLLSGLNQFGVMPTYGHALNAMNGERKQYIIMITPDEGFRIEFAPEKILVVSESKSIEEFWAFTSGVFEKLGKIYPNKLSNRLSIVTADVYKSSEEHYLELYKKLFTYKDVKPFEWDNRIAQKVTLENSEICNDISIIKRGQVRMPMLNGGELMDVILSETDINTDPRTTNYRFKCSEVMQTFEALRTRNQYSRQLLNRYFLTNRAQ